MTCTVSGLLSICSTSGNQFKPTSSQFSKVASRNQLAVPDIVTVKRVQIKTNEKNEHVTTLRFLGKSIVLPAMFYMSDQP